MSRLPFKNCLAATYTTRFIMPATYLMRRVLLAPLLAAFAALSGAQAEASTTRALLVGVSDYWNLDPKYKLKGPRNDVRELTRTLVEIGIAPGNIEVLADGLADLPDGVRPAADPTREAVVAGLKRLAAESQKGDLVIFYYSGHGSQQPDRDGDEGGGFDEIILPIDVGHWQDTVGTVEGAISDDELNVLTGAIRATGADLWAIVDACHAATGFRGGDTLSKARYVAPEAFGFDPSAVVANPAAEGMAVPQDAPGLGRTALFYASQEYQQAQERPLVGGADGDWHGVFTFSLIGHLRAGLGMTYRQLFQAIADDILSDGVTTAQTPEIEGTMLDQPVLGMSAEPGERRMRMKDGRLAAGLFEAVRPATILALYDTATAADPIGHAQVVKVEKLSSTLQPIAYPCATRGEDGLCPRADAADVIADARYALAVEPGLDFSVRLSPPQRIDPDDGLDYAAVLAGLKRVEERVAGRPGAITFDQAEFDVTLALIDGQLAIGGSSGIIDPAGTGSSLRITVPDDPEAAADTLEEAIRRIARVTALYRITSAKSGPMLALSAVTKPVEMKLEVLRPDPSLISGTRCPALRQARANGTTEPVKPSTVLGHCDIVTISARNRSIHPHDVTLLYVNGAFGIQPLWPGPGISNRLSTDQSISVPIRIETMKADGSPAPTGEERVIVLAVPAKSTTAERVVLTGLAQEDVRTRGDASPIERLLAEAMDPNLRTRSSGGLFDADSLYSAVQGFVVRGTEERASQPK